MPQSTRTSKLTVLSTSQSAPKFSLKGRWKEEKQRESAPGPGAYTPSIDCLAKFKQCNVTIQGKYEMKNRSTLQNPGPGAYGALAHTLAGPAGKEETAPRFSFGTGKRMDTGKKYSRMPGPGSYGVREMGNLKGGQGRTMGARVGSGGGFVAKRAGLTPGPGHYVPPVAVQESSPAFGFGTGSRGGPTGGSGVSKSGKVKGSTPGPGHYSGNNLGFRPGGPAFSMKSRSGSKSRERVDLTPGPGQFGGITSFG